MEGIRRRSIQTEPKRREVFSACSFNTKSWAQSLPVECVLKGILWYVCVVCVCVCMCRVPYVITAKEDKVRYANPSQVALLAMTRHRWYLRFRGQEPPAWHMECCLPSLQSSTYLLIYQNVAQSPKKNIAQS